MARNTAQGRQQRRRTAGPNFRSTLFSAAHINPKARSMKLKRILGAVAALAIVGTGLTMVTAGPAAAAGRPNALIVTGPCGDLLTFVERVAGTLIFTVTVPSTDANETWSLTATQQEYSPVTGGREGAPINLVPNPVPPLAFSPAEGGFTTTANFTDTPGFTHGFSYVATRTSPTPLTCANQGFFTNPGNGVVGPVAANPVGKPDTAPAPTGNNEADHGTHVAQLQFDQEMLATTQGDPAVNRFSVTVNGVARAVTGVSITNDNPPNKAVANLTLAGAVLGVNANVQVTYHAPLNNSDPQFQDLDGLDSVGFGPVAVPIL
jgi:hypothetical protein